MHTKESGTELKLKDILKVKFGQIAAYVENGKYPVYGAGHKVIGRSDEYNCENQLVIGTEGTLGEAKFIKEKAFIIKTALIITLTNKNISIEYLLNFLKAKNKKIKTLHSNQNIKRLTLEKFLEIKIFIPSFERQIEINKKIKCMETNLTNTSSEIKDRGKLSNFYRDEIFNNLKRVE